MSNVPFRCVAMLRESHSVSKQRPVVGKATLSLRRLFGALSVWRSKRLCLRIPFAKTPPQLRTLKFLAIWFGGMVIASACLISLWYNAGDFIVHFSTVIVLGLVAGYFVFALLPYWAARARAHQRRRLIFVLITLPYLCMTAGLAWLVIAQVSGNISLYLGAIVLTSIAFATWLWSWIILGRNR